MRRCTLSSHFSLIITVIAALLVVGSSAQNFETGDNSTVRGCSNHCSYKDSSLECWNNTLVFFEKILLGQMRNYVAVQMNIDQWKRRHLPDYKEDFEEAKRHSIQTMKTQLHPVHDVINENTIEAIVDTLVDLAARQSNHSLTWMPHFQCPIPCEHRFTVWRNLFILSSILNVCLLVSILPLMKRLHGNESSEALINRSWSANMITWIWANKVQLHITISSFEIFFSPLSIILQLFPMRP